MKLTQVKGNTWVIETPEELIPLYKLDGGRCILMDSGLYSEREELDSLLQRNGLTPVGILCSHAHVDHCANNGYFQKKYGAKVALTFPEAGMCSTVLNLKCYFLMLPPGMVERESSCMIHTPDMFIPTEDCTYTFCGVDFRILHTPGHSSGHVCSITPDNVCYTADALLSEELLEAKLPYHLGHHIAERSRQKLLGLGCDAYIMAHHGICSDEEIDDLVAANDALIRRRADEILALITQPMTASEIVQAACEHFKLFSKRPARTLRFERNIRFFIEYLVDDGRLEMLFGKGTTAFQPAPQE